MPTYAVLESQNSLGQWHDKSISTELLSSAAVLFSLTCCCFFCSHQKTGCLRLPFLTPLYQFRAVSLGQPTCSPSYPSLQSLWLKFQLFPGPECRCFPFSSAKRNKHRETTNYATALFFPHLPECRPLCLAWAAVLGNSTVFSSPFKLFLLASRFRPTCDCRPLRVMESFTLNRMRHFSIVSLDFWMTTLFYLSFIDLFCVKRDWIKGIQYSNCKCSCGIKLWKFIFVKMIYFLIFFKAEWECKIF